MNIELLTKTSHRNFDKHFKPIRPMLNYRVIRPFVIHEPSDDYMTLEFYHPEWPYMPVARIAEHYENGSVVKKYYIHREYCNVLGSFNKEKI